VRRPLDGNLRGAHRFSGVCGGTKVVWQARMIRAAWLGLSLAFAVASCGGSSGDDTEDQADGDGGPGGDSDGGLIGSDAAPEPNCPDDLPQDGTICTDEVNTGEQCAYERCSTVGMVIASCEDGVWSNVTSSCANGDCNGESCGPDSVCAAFLGGAFLVGCHSHTCEGALECSCVCPENSQCTRSFGSAEGHLFQCNTCPGPQPCP
jgi:hypothetical protein